MLKHQRSLNRNKMVKSKHVLETFVQALVEHQDEVVIKDSKDDMGILFNLTVSKSDMGRVIGRNGETAKALRTLLRAVGMTEDARINLKIDEPEGATPVDNTL